MNVENKNDHDIIIPIKCECKSEIECKCKCGYQTNINNEYLNNDNNNKIIHTVSIIAGIIGMIGLICVYTQFSSIYSSQYQTTRQPLNYVQSVERCSEFKGCCVGNGHYVGPLDGVFQEGIYGRCKAWNFGLHDRNAWRVYSLHFDDAPANLQLIDSSYCIDAREKVIEERGEGYDNFDLRSIDIKSCN